MLVKGIGMGGDLNPFAAPGDHREYRLPCCHHPNVVLQLGIYFSASSSSEKFHGSMNFASKMAPLLLTRPSSVAVSQRMVG